MKNIIFIFKSALDDFGRNKMRTFLTSLGILIGVFSVIVLIALGLGLKKYIGDQLASLGSNLMFAIPGSKETIMSGGGALAGIRFDDEDVKRLRRISSLQYIAPMFDKPGSILEAGDEREIVEIIASNEEIIQIYNLELEEGRLLDSRDIQKRAKVILISVPKAEKLFGTSVGVVGRNVELENQNFKVIGLIKAKGGGGLGPSIDDQVYIPFKASFSFNPEKNYYGINMKTYSDEQVPQAKEEVKEALLRKYDEDDFSVMEQKDLMDTIASIFGIINSVLVAIAAISLVVGGIGIMNIMYVTVTDRIKEVGIRRAIGARKSDIMSQFLAEAVLLSSIGGILGLGLAYLAVFAVQSFFPAYIDLGSVFLALGISSAIGVTFGVFPARKAANLEPVEAIRYE